MLDLGIKLAKKLNWYHPFLVLFGFLFFVAVGAVVHHKLPLEKISADIYVAEIELKDMTYDDASKLIENKMEEVMEEAIIIEVSGKEYQFSPTELGVEFDIYQTIENVYVAEYGENMWDRVTRTLGSLFQKIEVEPVMHIDREEFENTIATQIHEIREPQDAQIIFNEGEFQIIPHIDGVDVAYDQLLNQLIDSLTRLNPPSIVLDTSVVHPEVHDEDLELPLQDVNELLGREMVFVYHNHGKVEEYPIELTEKWINYQNEEVGTAKVKKSILRGYLEGSIAPVMDINAQNAVIVSLPDENLDYANVEGVAKDGRMVNIEKTMENFYTALSDKSESIELVVDVIKSQVINETGEDLGEMVLLSQGRSNFATSPGGRDFNVRRGLNEKVNNILLAPGGEYDFNKNLGPITNSAGWKNSLAIFGGRDLRPVPGGGLCQVSTTVYRAAVKGGFPITQQSNHSLYVHYYKEYGDGLDATIYPGVKNLKFTNDTDNYLLIQAYDDGYDAVVNIFGTPDGRSVELVGPFYPKDIPDDYKERISLRGNQIGWWQEIYDQDGNLVSEVQLTGTYRKIPY